MTNFSVSYIRDLLAFHVEAGVDVALGDAPVNRFAAAAAARAAKPAEAPPVRPASSASSSLAPSPLVPPRPAAPRAVPSVAPSPVMAAQPPDEAVMAAREAARAAGSLDELRAILDAFEGCPLKRTATRLVFADGKPEARVMFVGEAPGRDEDAQGLPFVGRSGRLLDLMMGAIGLDRTSAYIANVIPWRPPGNRTPTPQETAICLPFIRRQIELADPDILICLGNPSAQTLLGITEGITKTRGRFFSYDTGKRTIRAMPTFHPAYLLRTPLGKRLVWRDLLEVEAALGEAKT
ncbi:uracil-DNA glycosylase [Aquabacter sp. CN5-332]|uniref:uracil-DNA glycosylase n=1 Tax=Aquabacter sp. CN5-332 TaxID=3156608 RepID=UPI0032B51339